MPQAARTVKPAKAMRVIPDVPVWPFPVVFLQVADRDN
jgi:hypothetical protein